MFLIFQILKKKDNRKQGEQMESDRDRRFALEGFVRYHDDRIWKQTQKLVREEKEAITKMAVTLTAIRITAMLLISWYALHKFSGQ